MTARTSPSLPSAPAELDRWRRETPGCRDRIHLNNAGAALMPQAVLQALTGHLEREAAIGGYEAEDEAEPRVRETYELLGRLLVAVSWVPTNSGLVQDAAAVGAVCAELGVPYLIDACQVVGQLAVDVGALRCDFLAGTGRKFLRGPRGVGFLYVSDRMLERGAFPLFLDMRGADWTDPDAFHLADGARRFENWEFAYALVAGLGAAARYRLAVGSAGRERARGLAASLRPQLAETPGVRVLDRGREQCALVTVDVAGRDAADLKLRLRQRGINTSSADRKSGVLDMDQKRASTVLRFSPHYYNTEDELETAVAALAELARS